ncbi:alpha/beta hydrolase family protein [Ereboglobus luteus]|nr:hypothetical protein [Ereboglobus luteus]
MKSISEESPGAQTECLPDRQGKARLIMEYVPAAERSKSREPYRYDTVKKMPRWRDLDTLAAANSGISGFALRTIKDRQNSIPIGFDTNPDILYYASNVGRETYGIYGFNIKTGERIDLVLESEEIDLIKPLPFGKNFPDEDILIFDRHTQKLAGFRVEGRDRVITRWLSPEWQAVQKTLELSLPGCSVTIMEWSADGTRVLLHSSGPEDTGTYHVYHRNDKKIVSFAEKMPWLSKDVLYERKKLNFGGRGGIINEAIITVPRESFGSSKSFPVIVVFPKGAQDAPRYEFCAEPHVFASMGYVVLEMQYRRPPEKALITSDVIPALNELAKHMPVNLKRVILFGEDTGAANALTLLRMQPERFCGAVGINARVPGVSYFPKSRKMDGTAIRKRPGDERSITKPVYILNNRPRGGRVTDLQRAVYEKTKEYVGTLKKSGVDAAFDDLPDEYFENHSQAKAAVFANIENFINAASVNAKVELGPIKVVKTMSAESKSKRKQ